MATLLQAHRCLLIFCALPHSVMACSCAWSNGFPG